MESSLSGPRRTPTSSSTIAWESLPVGFSAEQQRLTAMLESMTGIPDGDRDALTIYTRPLTGAYYFVPSTESLRRV